VRFLTDEITMLIADLTNTQVFFVAVISAAIAYCIARLIQHVTEKPL
jgi:hypothetical protein